MGEDARWVCSTCKTVCYRGGTPIFEHIPPGITTVQDIKAQKAQFCLVMETIRLVGDDKDHYISFFDDLMVWLTRHEGHYIYIGSDSSTDMWDFDDFHRETLEGTVDPMSIDDRLYKSEMEIGLSEVHIIAAAIQKCIDDPGVMPVEKVAKELHDKFSARML